MTEPMKTFELHEIFPEIKPVEETTENVVENLKKSFTVKGVARMVVGSSVKFVVTSTIASLVPVDSKKDKIKVLVGGYVISGVISEQAKRYINEDLDAKFEFCRDVYNEVKKQTTAKQSEAPADVPNP